MDENKLAELIVEALNRVSEARAASAEAKAEEKARAESVKSLMELNAALKKSSSATKTFERILSYQQTAYKNVNDELEKLSEAYDNAATITEKAAIKKQREELESAKNMQNLHIAISNVSVGFIKLGNTLGNVVAGAAGDFVKGLQRGSSGVELSAGLMTAGVDAANAGMQAASGAAGSLGQVLSTSTNKKVQALGLAAQGAGIALGFIGNTSSKLAKFGIEVLTQEILKTSEAFSRSSSAGAMFSDGMSGIRNSATQAGLRVDQFAGVISRQSGTLASTGLSVGEAARQIGKVGSVLKKEGLDLELLKLGYGFEEQAELVAEVMSDMRRSKDAAMLDPARVAQNTRDYAENLRVIASLTGEDARQKMQEARRITADTAFRIKLMEKEKQQPGILDQMNRALSTMPPTMQTAIKQLATFGAVSDETAAAQMATNQNFANIVNRTLEMYNNNTLDAARVQKVMGEEADNYNKRLSASGTAATEFAIGVAAQNKKLTELGQAQDAFTQMVDRFSSEGVRRAQEDAKRQGKTPDELTDSFVKAQKQAQEFALALQDGILPMIKDFTTVSKKMLQELDKMLGDVTKEIKEGKAAEAQEKRDEPGGNFWDRNKRTMVREAAGVTTGLLTGAATLPAAATGVGAVATGAAATGGYFTGLQLGDVLNDWFFGKEGKSRGGIATGPKSGFIEKLHGTEAVVPLPDGKTIPVQLAIPPQRDEAKAETRVEAAPRAEPKTDFSFMGALSGITQSLSKAGAVLKDTFVINNKDLAAAFSQNKLTAKEVDDLLKTRTPVKEQPTGVFEAMFTPILNGFKTITRDFMAGKRETKVDTAGELKDTVKKLAERPKPVEEPKEQPRLTKTESKVELSGKSVSELKGLQKSGNVDPMVSKITEAIKGPDQTKLLDRLKESDSRSSTDQAVSNLTGEVRRMSMAKPTVEVKDIDGLRQLSPKSITEALAKQSAGAGAENCSAMVAKYIEENKNQFGTTGTKIVEDFSKQLLGTTAKSKPGATDTEIARSIKDLPKANAGLSRSFDETGGEIKSGLNNFKFDLTAALNGLVNELRGTQSATESTDAEKPQEIELSTEDLFKMLRDAILTGNSSVKEAILAQSELVKTNIDKIDQLVAITDDNRGINQQMLNNTY